ncbi:MAG: sigma-54-dependent transcriptional regulator, partial [Phycisphaerales bacterium]
NVLVVDDKDLLRDSVGATLTRAGLEVATADSAEAALNQIAKRRPDAVVTDLKMPGGTGIDLIRQIRAFDDDLPVILMTAFGTVETAVEALKSGAFDYLTKPFEGDELVIAVKRAIEHARVVRENAVLRAGVGQAAGASAGSVLKGLDRLVGDSAAMRRVKEQALAVAESHGTVLVCGESGTGKEVVARAVHEMSLRRDGPFLGMNCAALSESLLESELFGHERGAFTGAEKLRKGRFELSDRGTLLLDEISEVSTRVQAKLLRVLQERAFERVGSSTPIGVDVRIIATSNQDLPRAVSAGRFRQDLFFRLNVLPIHMPPLRDRLEDLPLLAQHFAGILARREGRDAVTFEPGAFEAFKTYTWPGNVRELQNIVERAAVLSRGRPISADLVSPWLCAAVTPPMSVAATNGHAAAGLSELKPASAPTGLVPILNRALDDIERDAIVQTLVRLGGHRQKTAHALGIGVRTLGLKLKKWKTLSLVDSGL